MKYKHELRNTRVHQRACSTYESTKHCDYGPDIKRFGEAESYPSMKNKNSTRFAASLILDIVRKLGPLFSSAQSKFVAVVDLRILGGTTIRPHSSGPFPHAIQQLWIMS